MFYGATTAASISHENMFKHIGKVAPYDVIVLSLSHWHTQINLIVKFYEGTFQVEFLIVIDYLKAFIFQNTSEVLKAIK